MYIIFNKFMVKKNDWNIPNELKWKISGYYASPELTSIKNSNDFVSLLKKDIYRLNIITQNYVIKFLWNNH